MIDSEMIVAREAMMQSNLAISDVQASYIAIYLSMVFAYTTVAYIAGKQLSTFQVAIASVVYISTSFYVVITIIAMTVAFQDQQSQIAKTFEQSLEGAQLVEVMLWLDIAIWPLAMLVSLLFMWNVRRGK